MDDDLLEPFYTHPSPGPHHILGKWKEYGWENLEELTLDSLESVCNVFEVAPKLRRVTFITPNIEDAIDFCILPWSQIETLTLRSVEMNEESIEFVSKFSNLTELSLDQCYADPFEDPEWSQRVSFHGTEVVNSDTVLPSRLIKLSLMYHRDSEQQELGLYHFLRSFSFPSLTNLDIRTPAELQKSQAPFFVGGLQNFLQPCKLTTFSTKCPRQRRRAYINPGNHASRHFVHVSRCRLYHRRMPISPV